MADKDTRAPLQPVMRRLLEEHGMLIVLLLLGALFSVLTVRETPPDDLGAARKLAAEIVAAHGKDVQVMIAARMQAEDAAFANALETELVAQGVTVPAVVKGEPRDAKLALRKIAESGGKLDVIACHPAAAGWLVFSAVREDFPTLGKPVIAVSRGGKWPAFLQKENLLNIANQIAVIAIVAIGMTMVIIGGGIDLSVGSLIALAAVVAALLIRNHAGAESAGAWGMTGACVAAVLLCALVSTVAGVVITRMEIPPFIVTLAVMLMAGGLAYLLSGGESVYQVPESFVWLGRGADLAGLPNAVLLMLALYIAAHLVMRHTTFGRHLYAVGGNREAALLSGVRVRRVLTAAYAVCGLLAGLGGVVMASQLKSGSPTYGQMYELYVIAAVVVGGASLSGGRGRMFGTLVGALIIAVIQNGMNLTNVESHMQKVVLGFVVLTAVMVDRLRRK